MQIIRMPSLAENVNEATVAQWLVAEHEAVAAKQGIAELLTEKATFTFEVEVAGTVSAILVPEKSVLPVGGILCLLDASPEEIAAAREENDALIEQHLAGLRIDLPTTEKAVSPVVPSQGRKVRATPAARRLAKEHHLDLAAVADSLAVSGALKEEHLRAYLGTVTK